MTIWNKVKEGIDKAGKAAQDAFDEGKTRIDAYRAREQADKAAEAFGYAVFRALELGKEIDADSKERLVRSLRERDAEARRLETELAEGGAKPSAPGTPGTPGTPGEGAPAAGAAAGSAAPPPGAAESTPSASASGTPPAEPPTTHV